MEIDNHKVVVKGPCGPGESSILELKIEKEGDVLQVIRQGKMLYLCSLHGLSRTLLANMVEGGISRV